MAAGSNSQRLHAEREGGRSTAAGIAQHRITKARMQQHCIHIILLWRLKAMSFQAPDRIDACYCCCRCCSKRVNADVCNGDTRGDQFGRLRMMVLLPKESLVV